MIELPEATTIARDLKKAIVGKVVKRFIYGSSEHKFAFFNEEIEENSKTVIGKKITKIIPRCFYIEIEIEDYTLLFRDGTNIRYHKNSDTIPDKHQLLIEFDDVSYISVSVAMYGFISLSKGVIDNKYYQLEVNGVSPLSDDFSKKYYLSLLDDKTRKLSAKAFVATEQRMIGIGNGVTQDILFNAEINPRTKMESLSEDEIDDLYVSIKKTLMNMIELNGRDTEKDIYGEYGGYKTVMGKNNVGKPCPSCREIIKKENYLGGSIYYCPNCQKIK